MKWFPNPEGQEAEASPLFESTEQGLVEQVWALLDEVHHYPEKEKTKAMLREMVRSLELFSRKQSDYTSINISLAGEAGVFTRICDKWARLFSHYRLNKKLLNERVEDTWRDLAVYALIALLVRSGQWRLTPEELQALGINLADYAGSPGQPGP
jgi:hypothetical protein